MGNTKISVTDAARNFADCVNRAHYQNETFVLLKNGLPVAKLVPPDSERLCRGRDLAAVLADSPLPSMEASAWHGDLQSGRRTLKPPTDKWQ